MRKFLTAEWRDLVMANYEVDPSVLCDRVPHGVSLDLHDGRCFISLVGFMFLNTRVLGLPIPFHVNFEEVNLRFYVKREMPDEIRRGVCFVKEIVPRPAIALVAKAFYGEPYEYWWMTNVRKSNAVAYGWGKGECLNRMATGIATNRGVPEAGSHGEFIIEHYWGYTRRGDRRTDEYRVEHPKWELHDVVHPKIDVDFGRVYGDEFGFLTSREPYSVVFAKGSEIAVHVGERLSTR
jgi:uncharacterized protein YqjF (DUF2071 family)